MWAWWTGLVLASIQVAVATRQFALFQDDFIFLMDGRGTTVVDGQVVGQALDWDYLSRPLFEHFSPITRFLFWVLGSYDDPRAVSRGMVVVLLCATVCSLGAITWSILGRTWPALVVAMIASQALVLSRIGAWTTASFNILPAAAFGCLAVALSIRYLRNDAGWPYAAGAVVCYGLSVLGYEIAMVTPLIIGAWFVACEGIALGRRGTIERLKATAWFWGGLVVIGAVSLANFRLNYYNDDLPRSTLGQTVRALWYSLVQGLLPAVVGIHRPVAGAYGWQTVLAGLMWCAIVSIALLLGRWAAVRAMSVAVATWLICAGVLAVSRAAVFGLGVAMELYYAAFPLLGLVVSASEVSRAISANREDHSLWRWVSERVRQRRAVIVGVGMAAAVLFSAVMLQMQSDRVTNVAGGFARRSGEFSSTFLEDVAELDQPPSIVSSVVPFEVVSTAFYPYNWATRNVGLLTTDVRWNSAVAPVYRVAEDGHLVAVTVQEIVPLPHLRSAEMGDDAVFDGGDCVTFTTSVAAVRLMLPASVGAEALAVRLVGSIDQESTTTATAMADGGPAGSLNGDEIVWTPGAIDVLLPTSLDELQGIALSGFRPGTVLCLTDATIVAIRDST